MLMVNETALALAMLAAEQATMTARHKASQRENVMNRQWYLAHGGGSEKRTIDEFERSDIEYYYPQTWGQQRVPKRELTPSARKNPMAVMRPIKIGLWRGYFFVLVDLASSIWREPFERADVHGIIANSEGGRLLPAPITQKGIDAIRSLEVNGVIPPSVKLRELLFKVDECVALKGAFAEGVIAEDVEKPIGGLDESTKAKVMVRLLGRSFVVEVPIGDIEKL